jgi:hypothetical protein
MELSQVPVLAVVRVGASAGDPVHRALGHQILERAPHGLPRQPVLRDEL